MIPILTSNFPSAFHAVKAKLLSVGDRVHTQRWQGIAIDKNASMRMVELMNVAMSVPLNGIEDLDYWRGEIRPNLPWADDHFAERVGGDPINPGESWKTWPYNKSAANFLDANGQFNHNYMERFWPKYAGDKDMPNRGIRHPYGDLNDVIDLMHSDPLTRQAYLPIFFPEDTGVGDGDRKPCTLGYHFIMRGNLLHVVYHIRSCDYVRHFRDDCYLAVRLLLWTLDQLRLKDPKTWGAVIPGAYTMYVTSLHCFINDYHALGGK